MMAAHPELTPLFKKEPNGSVYRIPSLIYIKVKNMFLAFAEERISESDASAKYLVMRRGVYETGNATWENVKALTEVYMENHRTMNPCPVYEDTTKVLFLFFNCIPEGVTETHMKMCGNASKMCYVTSRDYGETWSSIFDITDLTNNISNLATIFFSPGHGIQTSSGKLIVPAYVYVASCRCICWCNPKAQSFYFYSEDQGNTWRISEQIDKFECGECELAEIMYEDNKRMLYLNARGTSKKRVEAQMLDAGGEFQTVEESSKLKELCQGCFGSVVSFLGTEQPGQDWLLFSHPTKEGRKDLGIYLNKSPLMSKEWSRSWIIHKGPAAYSDLAVWRDGKTCAILFESGVASPYEEINFCLFTVDDVLVNINKK